MNREEMIEKIRERVVMANNPECKSYEEALEVERWKDGCVFIIENCCIKAYNGEQYTLSKDSVVSLGDYSGVISKDDVDNNGNLFFNCFLFSSKVLGLPLTLERILISIYKNRDVSCEISLQKNIFLCQLMHSESLCEFFEWLPNKTLEQQSEETIKAIYDILK